MDTRLVLSASPNSALMLWASRSHSAPLSVTYGGNRRPGYAGGGWCGDGRVSCWKVTDTEWMPSFSAKKLGNDLLSQLRSRATGIWQPSTHRWTGEDSQLTTHGTLNLKNSSTIGLP